jgi:hypothetical protein
MRRGSQSRSWARACRERVDERLDAVRELWATYREEGVERAIALLDPAVEFVDHQGRAFTGHAGVRRFFAEIDERSR